MKTLLLLLIFFGLCLLGYPAMNIKHHLEANHHSTLRRRLKRSGTYEKPLQVSQKKAYLQTDHAYQLPCTVIRPGESVSIVFWLRGESLDPAFRDVILRQAYPNDGFNFALAHYQISSSYGIIIDPVNMTDTNRYWCKTVRKPANQFVEDYLDVTVVDKTFPKDNDTFVDETSVSLSIESENTIQCPLLPQAPIETDTTVYWSILTDKDNRFGIIFAKFANGDILAVQEYAATYGLEGNNGLYIKSFKRRDERYCCHVFEQGNDLRTACIDVTWLAVATEKRPTILDCDSVGESCEVKIEPHQDWLQLECSINEVYPKPTLSWSYKNCEESPTFVTTSSSTENPTTEVFNVQSKVYLIGLQPSFDQCNLVCTAQGEGIPDETKPANVAITRITETTTSRIVTSTRTCPVCNDSVLGVLLFLAIVVAVLIYAVLRWPKSRQFVQSHFGICCWFPDQSVDPKTDMLRPKIDLESPEDVKMIVTTPLMSTGDKDKGVGDEKKDKVCLENRGSEDVDMTDANFIWNYLGQLVTEPALEMGDMCGFQTITDVIGIQDGGVVVIDSKGLHLFTVEYQYRFIDKYKACIVKSYICVAYFTTNKLLFGLDLGKLVIFDIANEQINNFCSVTPVKDKIVKLKGIAVNSRFVLASDEAGKTISVFDNEGVCLKRLDTPSCEPGSVALHVCKETVCFFVTSRDVVRKYNVYGQKSQSKITHSHHFDINKESLAIKEFKPSHVSVQGDNILIESHMEDSKLLLVSQLNIRNGEFQRSIIARAPNIRCMKFISGDRIVLYTENAVHVLDKGNAKPRPMLQSAVPLACPLLIHEADVKTVGRIGPTTATLPPRVADVPATRRKGRLRGSKTRVKAPFRHKRNSVA